MNLPVNQQTNEISVLANKKTPQKAGFHKKSFKDIYSATTSKATSVSCPLPKSIFAL